jgi:hypothetical protein
LPRIGRAMALWLQNLLALTVVGGCAAYAGWQAAQSLWGKRSRIGSCCSRGCGHAEQSSTKPATERIVFIPVEALRRRK